MTQRPLNQLQTGDCGVIHSTPTGQLAGRLAEIGFHSGNTVEVMQAGAPMVVRIGETRLCLRSELAAAIQVLCPVAL